MATGTLGTGSRVKRVDMDSSHISTFTDCHKVSLFSDDSPTPSGAGRANIRWGFHMVEETSRWKVGGQVQSPQSRSQQSVPTHTQTSTKTEDTQTWQWMGTA